VEEMVEGLHLPHILYKCCCSLKVQKDPGGKLWPVRSDGDKDREVMVEIITVCDPDHILRVSKILLSDGLDVGGAGKIRKKILSIKENFKTLPECLKGWNCHQLGR
jgi:hypothetical protein